MESNKTILIAEDEDLNFLLLEELLADLDTRIIRSTNGLDAVETCQANPNIDLVLMDMKMPIMDGFEATRQIKTFRPDLPIVAQTAYSTDADRRKAKECGCVEFVSKPFRAAQMVSLVRGYLYP